MVDEMEVCLYPFLALASPVTRASRRDPEDSKIPSNNVLCNPGHDLGATKHTLTYCIHSSDLVDTPPLSSSHLGLPWEGIPLESRERCVPQAVFPSGSGARGVSAALLLLLTRGGL